MSFVPLRKVISEINRYRRVPVCLSYWRKQKAPN